MVNKIGYSIVEQLTKNRFFITHPLLEILKKYISEHTPVSYTHLTLPTIA